MHHICIRFSKNFSGRSPDPTQLRSDPIPLRTHTATPLRSVYKPPPAVHLVFGSVTDNAMYIFNAILLKINLSLSEFKRLYLHPRLHHFASFFQNFLGGGPPNPHQREGTPLPYPPHSALWASRKPPRLSSGSATA